MTLRGSLVAGVPAPLQPYAAQFQGERLKNNAFDAGAVFAGFYGGRELAKLVLKSKGNNVLYALGGSVLALILVKGFRNA